MHFATNDKRSKISCDENEDVWYDIIDILRLCFLKRIMDVELEFFLERRKYYKVIRLTVKCDIKCINHGIIPSMTLQSL